MTRRHRLGKILSHKVDIDIKGIAVALAFLVSVSVFAGNRDNPTASENRTPPVAAMQIAPTSTIEDAETIRRSDDETELSGTLRTDQYFPHKYSSTYPGVTSN